jgi:nucleotidyltransferase substrate binding protein (TIGR01987 family)
MTKDKFQQALHELQHAFSFEKQSKKDSFYFSGIAKCFEVALEYAWTYLKELAESEGLEVTSPKDAIRKAGQIGVISDVEMWLKFLEARNIAVHDYLGLPQGKYLEQARLFLQEAGKLSRGDKKN